jgi:hypothetical protein
MTKEEATILSQHIIAATRHPMDDPENAENIVEFWKRGTASSGEAKIIETYLALDDGLKRRFFVLFPAIVRALRNAGYR